MLRAAWRPLLIATVGLIAWMVWALLRTTAVIETVTVTTGEVENSIPALGMLRPHRYVEIGAQASGVIRRLHVRAGDSVQEKQLLVEIDPSLQQATADAHRATLESLRAQLEEREAQAALAKTQLERQQRLAAAGLVRTEDIQIAATNWRTTAAQIKDLNAQIKGALSMLQRDAAELGYTRIYAPMSGTVLMLDAREGQTLNATYQTPTIMRLADLSTMTVWTEVSEADIAHIRVGMPLYFTTLGSAQRHTATVTQVLPAPLEPPLRGTEANSSPASAANTGQVVLYTVLFDIANPHRELMPQMSAQVFFVTARAHDVIVAPLSALQALPDKPDFYTAEVLVAGNIQQREVHAGVRNRLSIEVLSGLQAGEQLVTSVRQARAASGKFQW